MRIGARLICCCLAIYALTPGTLPAQDPPTQPDTPAAETESDEDSGSEATTQDQDAQADNTAEAMTFMADGIQALRFGDLKAAKKAFSGALKLDRKLAWANFALGLVYHLEDDFKNAARYYKKETQYYPACGEAYLNWGACEAQMNRHAGAVLAFVDAIRRLGIKEEYVNNLGKAVTVLRRETDDEEPMTAELRRALQTYDELEATLNARLLEKGMARWGSSTITLEQKRDIDDRIVRYDQMIQDQVLQLNDYVFEVNTVRRRINDIRLSLKEYREIQEERGPLEAELTRLELRLRDLQDNIRLARANIEQLQAQKPQPPWNQDYAFLREVPTPKE
jgi:chromosome segregation ATPase